MNKRNHLFEYLQAMLIIMVIDDHVSSRIGLFTSVFPYDSFFMPAFVIISGYFYSLQSVEDNIKHKVVKIFIPYTAWCAVGNIVAYVLEKRDIVFWYNPPSLKNTLLQCFYAPISEISGAGWFAIMIFYVAILYNIVRQFNKKPSFSFDYWLLFFSVCLGLAVTWVCYNHYISGRGAAVVLRIGFYFQFYHIGYMFRNYWEKEIIQWKTIIVCSVCVGINVVLVCLYGDRIKFIGTVAMELFQTWHLPIVTSITGFIFWYEIAKILSSQFKESKMVSFLARNTFTIMMVHLFFTKIPGFAVLYAARHTNYMFGDFDVEKFQANPWYNNGSALQLLGFFFGLIGSCLIISVVEKLRPEFVKTLNNFRES